MFLKGRPVTMFMPKDQVDSYSLEDRGELPSNKLKLDWVYPDAAAREFSAEVKAKMKRLLQKHKILRSIFGNIIFPTIPNYC